ncbi:hypothetical protein GJ744_008275 [Endocarpon pusillum]|uniref:DUF1772-domain-containing protein n=1 Tax=Endocarpon pusillum TaxID=364733 RepID=A0A8H7E5F9_9EURO|nr:hypothetical protein GJ744_008275 [Endocarpon pusillum]
MAFTNDALWFLQPFQIFSTLGAAVNFGGSVLQSPLIMPMLQMPEVPVKYAGQQTAYLLHHSEHIFPPLNAACTLSNLITTIIAYLNRNSHSAASAKLPYLYMATAANFATTAYALLIMVPMNRRQTAIAEKLKDKENESEEKELRRLQTRWQQRNYGRAMIMIAGSVAGMMALLAQHT